MIYKIIKTEAEYQEVINRTIAIFDAKEGTPEAEELTLLLVLIKDYEDKNKVT
jgi:HTH-type transcriptional regulator / antitoxin HigA